MALRGEAHGLDTRWRESRDEALLRQMRELREQADHADLTLRLLGDAGLPTRHTREAQRLIDADVEWGDKLETTWALCNAKPGLMVLLSGPRGTGKTTLATACGLGMANLGRTVAYTTAGDLLRGIRATYGRGHEGPGEQAVFNRHAKAGLLIIDEVHERPTGEHDAQMLTAILDTRYAAERATLLVTNEQPEAAAASLGPSVADRMAEAGRFVELLGKSWRSSAA